MATLNTVFKEVFSEGLKDEGFVKIKGRQPYIVRVVNGEILHIITCRNEWCGEKGYKAFDILCDVATIYRPAIDLTKTPNQNIEMLKRLRDIWVNTNPTDDIYWKQINKFIYKEDNIDSLYKEMEAVLGVAKKVILPVFNQAMDLDSCLECFRIAFSSPRMAPPNYIENEDCFKFQSGMRYEEIDFNESLVYIQADNHDDLTASYEKLLQMELLEIEHADYYRDKDEQREKARYFAKENRLLVLSQRDKIYNNPKAYKRALEVLENNKRRNLEILCSYGIKI